MTNTDDTRLDALLGELRSENGVTMLRPPFLAQAGQSADEWLQHISYARAMADEAAIEHRRRVDAAAVSLFGRSVASFLPEPSGLTRQSIRVPVRDAQLADLVPALKSVAPRGPGAPVPLAARTEVSVRVTSTPSPELGIVRLHGGAFWMGGGPVSSQIDAALLDHVAVTANAVIFDVDYALAPERPYPAAIIDALCVLDAVRSGSLGWRTPRVALMGTSSGANTAAIAARADALRDVEKPVSALALIVPSVLLAEAPAELRADEDSWAARTDLLLSYLGSGISADDAWVSPGVEPVIAGMPATFAAVASRDEVAVGGEALCDAIVAGGSLALARTYAMTHTTAPPEVEAAVIRDTAAFLRDPAGFLRGN